MLRQVILGSCVARDSLEDAAPGTFELATYIARQSLTSISRPSSAPRLRALNFASKFQNRLFHGDLQGDALDRVVEAAIAIAHDDLAIVLDLIDERGGIFLHQSDGVITRTIDGHNRGAYTLLDEGWTFHGFGSMKHWTLYTAAAKHVKGRLEEAGLFDRVRVLEVRWADKDETGAATKGSFGFFAKTANEVLEGYYETLRSAGWCLVSPGIKPIADSQHKWGPAPFHYTHEYYDAMNASLLKSFEEHHLPAQGMPNR